MTKKDNLYVELTPELIKRAQERVDFISNEGCKKNGVLSEVDTTIKPEWYDEERFKRGQAIALDNYAAGVNCAVFGLLIFLQLPIGLLPLLATGKSKNLPSLFNRYFDTMQFVDEWYCSDPFDPKSKSFKIFSIVKLMHTNASKLMNEKVTVFEFAKKVLKESNPEIKDEEIELYIRNKDRVWVSQFDMALIQFSFLGCLVLESKAGGYHNATKKDIEDILYSWKVFSYRLGIDPKYSLIEEIDYDLIYAICKIILEQEYIRHLENVSCQTGIRMTEAILTSVKDILVGSNCNVYLRYWYKTLNINSYKLNRSLYENDQMELIKISTKNQLTEKEKEIMLKNGFNNKYIVSDYNIPFELYKLNGLKEKILYQLYLFLFNYGLKYKIVRKFAKNFIRNAIIQTRENRQKVVNEISKNDNSRYKFPECPFTGSIKTETYPDVYQKE